MCQLCSLRLYNYTKQCNADCVALDNIDNNVSAYAIILIRSSKLSIFTHNKHLQLQATGIYLFLLQVISIAV